MPENMKMQKIFFLKLFSVQSIERLTASLHYVYLCSVYDCVCAHVVFVDDVCQIKVNCMSNVTQVMSFIVYLMVNL